MCPMKSGVKAMPIDPDPTPQVFDQLDVDDDVDELHFLQLHKTAQRGKDMVHVRDLPMPMDPLDIAHLFCGPLCLQIG